jgi:choline kinase
MKVVMLAAGIGAGLGNSRTLNLPNILLRFDDRSLLQRHISILKRSGIEELVLGAGFNRDGIDYSVDVERTNAEILPLLSASTRHASPNAVTDVATGRTSKHERC